MSWFPRSLMISALALLSACSTTQSNPPKQELQRQAKWALLPLVNYAQTPQAGERAEQILSSLAIEKYLQLTHYPVQNANGLPALDDQERLDKALIWARSQGFQYALSGSIEEWQYKNGLDGEPAVGITLQVLDPASGQVIWSASGARAGWSRESLAGAAQRVLDDLVDELPLE